MLLAAMRRGDKCDDGTNKRRASLWPLGYSIHSATIFNWQRRAKGARRAKIFVPDIGKLTTLIFVREWKLYLPFEILNRARNVDTEGEVYDAFYDLNKILSLF